MDKKYLCNGRRVRLTELSDNDLGFDPQRPIVIYDRRIESEVGTGSFGNLPIKVRGNPIGASQEIVDSLNLG